MGNKNSRNYDDEREKIIILNNWDDFIESCCIKDEASYISFVDLCSLFACYLRDNLNIECNYVEYVYTYIDSLLKIENLTLTPGWVVNSYQFSPYKVDTRLVLGLKIVSLKKKQV